MILEAVLRLISREFHWTALQTNWKPTFTALHYNLEEEEEEKQERNVTDDVLITVL